MNFETKNRPMICGSYEAEIRKYHSYSVKSGAIWLVADQPNAGDNVYFWSPRDTDQGFGGRELSFQLVNGEILKLKGPWHSNSEGLFKATGVDVRDKHLTFGVISLDREFKEWQSILIDVVYQDKTWTLGHFNRIERLAKLMSQYNKRDLCYYQESQGGSCCGVMKYND